MLLLLNVRTVQSLSNAHLLWIRPNLLWQCTFFVVRNKNRNGLTQKALISLKYSETFQAVFVDVDNW